MTLGLHLLPLGATMDYLSQGEWIEAGLSLAGDVSLAFGVGLVGKAAQAGRAGNVLNKVKIGSGVAGRASQISSGTKWARRGFYISTTAEAVAGGYRGVQSAVSFYNGEYVKASGEAGEALLRVLGVTATHVRYAHLKAEANAKIKKFDDLLAKAEARKAGIRFEVSIDDNKLHHIFAKAKHKLQPLVKAAGSEAQAYQEVLKAITERVRSKGIVGIYEEVVMVRGMSVTVRGIVLPQGVEIGSFWIK